ncbi:toxin glutamine deamidase domain-containing protein [Nocardia sp. NPDC058176]|uniref:toxin glutamine deamidase domain-containing protein n=1 Tax=Nocardia sp. NPDC058176 TaxID=3346368 RepID=UPI0036D77C4D
MPSRQLASVERIRWVASRCGVLDSFTAEKSVLLAAQQAAEPVSVWSADGLVRASGTVAGVLNDGGTEVDGRDNNCLDCALSAISSFFGVPRIAVPRWPDGTPVAEGESDGGNRATNWLGRG